MKALARRSPSQIIFKIFTRPLARKGIISVPRLNNGILPVSSDSGFALVFIYYIVAWRLERARKRSGDKGQRTRNENSARTRVTSFIDVENVERNKAFVRLSSSSVDRRQARMQKQIGLFGSESQPEDLSNFKDTSQRGLETSQIRISYSGLLRKRNVLHGRGRVVSFRKEIQSTRRMARGRSLFANLLILL